MDLSKKVQPVLEGMGSEEFGNHPPTQLQRPMEPSAPPDPYRFPISSASFIHATPNHQYHTPDVNSHYFLSQGHEESRYNPMYGVPSPLFMVNPHVPLAESTLEDEGVSYASQFLDGMLGQGAHGRDHQNQQQGKGRVIIK